MNITIREKAIGKSKRVIRHVLRYKFFRIIPDSIFLKIIYRMRFDKKLDLKNPKTFNEKLQWLKLYDRRPEYIQMVDKYAVKKYIADTLGEKYVIPLLGVYNSYDEIDFDALPNQFVLKPNHSSGDIYICRNKSEIDYSSLAMDVKRWLKRRFFWETREWPYKKIKPKVICEKYMVDESGFELKDYKLSCFNGEVKFCVVCSNRPVSGGVKMDYYDMNWELLPFKHASYPNSDILVPKPKDFDEMVRIATLLSKDISFLRVDLYETDKQVYFGELTFSPCSGYGKIVPESYDNLLGSWMQLKDHKRDREPSV